MGECRAASGMSDPALGGASRHLLPTLAASGGGRKRGAGASGRAGDARGGRMLRAAGARIGADPGRARKPRRLGEPSMANRYRLWGPLAFAMALAQPAAAGSLNFAADVPQPPKALPLLRLTLQPAPTQLVDRLLSRSRSAARLAPLSEAPLLRNSRASTSGDMLVALKDEHARAWVNRRTGDAYIYPDLDNIEALSQGVAAAQASSAEAIFNSADFIARDDTRVVVGKPDVLEEQTLTRDANGEVRTERQKAPYLAYFSARRFVGDLPVDGPGSRALLVL